MTAVEQADFIAPRRIVIVDDHPLLRQSLKQLISDASDLSVCAEADSVAGATVAIESSQPDLLLLDLRLRGGDALEFLKAMRTRFPVMRILVISQQEETLFAERSLRAGADGYITKQEAPEEVLTAIQTVLSGETYVSRGVSVMLYRKSVDGTQPRRLHGFEELTDRELYVFQRIGAGLTCAAIAEEMHLSVKTVETHREHIKNKLVIADSKELARVAREWLAAH